MVSLPDDESAAALQSWSLLKASTGFVELLLGNESLYELCSMFNSRHIIGTRAMQLETSANVKSTLDFSRFL